MNSVIVDVAIGMIFFYLLLSLIASVIQEILATFMQLRPANLQRALRSMTSGNAIGPGLDLVNSIYDHGLVRGLYMDPMRDLNPDTEARKTFDTDQSPEAAQKRKLINPRPLDWLRVLLRRLIGITPAKELTVVTNQLLLPAYIPSRTFALAMIDMLNKNKQVGVDVMIDIRQYLAAHHAEFQDNKATEALLALATDAQGDLKKFQHNLESWYNSAMDRASGWYKKYTQSILLVTGLLLAMIFNVDSIRVVRVLWFDRDARQGMVDAASQYMKDHPNPPAKPGVADPSFNVGDLENRLNGTAQQFRAVANSSLLPVGWGRTFRDGWFYFWDNKAVASWHIIELFPGWMVTALAVSLGAPFWFDLLNKFMVVRGTVKPDEKSVPETSKS
jgi:hypothetical protein